MPVIWSKLRDSEKWQVGHSYAEAFNDGRTTAVSGLKSALLKVKGFDYVPENLRSDAFVKVADAIIKAHEGLNNFYNESAPVKQLAKLGSTIPTPALQTCFIALLCVVLGNRYGTAWGAEGEAKNLLSKITKDRWEYYLNNVLPGDTRILNKLSDDKPRENWIKIVEEYKLGSFEIKNKTVNELVLASGKGKGRLVEIKAKQLLVEYYGKSA